jgi:uncharacterized protein (DUF2336 family)
MADPFERRSQQNAIGDIKDALAGIETGRHAEKLRRVADLFVSGSSAFSAEQVALFDDIMSQLVVEIDIAARAIFGRELLSSRQAPRKTVRLLALDDAIEVAGPILSRFVQLDEETLVEGAKTKSQNHLFEISGRRQLSPAVTDVLVKRGDRRVVIGTAANPGAEFSEFGYSTLVARAHDDDDLSLCVWLRSEIPRQHLLRLFAEASETVRARLESADRRKGRSIREMVARVSSHLQTEVRDRSSKYAAARAHVQSLHDLGALSERNLKVFAREGKFDETTIALSLMCDLPIGFVESAVVDDRTEQIIVLAKSIGLSWDTTRAILLIQAGTKGSSTHELELALANFTKLKPEIAKRAIAFYRSRARADLPGAPR